MGDRPHLDCFAECLLPDGHTRGSPKARAGSTELGPGPDVEPTAGRSVGRGGMDKCYVASRGHSASPVAGLLLPLQPPPHAPPLCLQPARCFSALRADGDSGSVVGSAHGGGRGLPEQGALSSHPSAPGDPMTSGLPLSGKPTSPGRHSPPERSQGVLEMLLPAASPP